MDSTSLFKRFLAYNNAPLFFMGSGLQTGSVYLKISEGLLLVIGVYFSVLDCIDLFVHKYRLTKIGIAFKLIANLIVLVGYLQTVILFSFKRKEIVLLSWKLFRVLDRKYQTKVIRRSLLLALLAFGYNILVIVLKNINVVIKGQNFGITFYNTILESFSAVYVVTGCFLYLSFCKLLDLNIMHNLFSVKKYLLKSNTSNMVYVDKVLDITLRNMEKFDDMFNLLPFVWLSQNFAFASSAVLTFLTDSETGYLYIAFFLLENATMVSVVCFLSKKKKDVKKEIYLIRRMLSVKTVNTAMGFVINSINRNLESIASFKMTAWPHFFLDYSLIFSFLGSVLTFTVLFVQLTQSVF
jgi:hypothetical protein